MAEYSRSVTDDLKSWFRSRLHGSDQAVPYHLSPKWKALMEEIYAEYDVLERRREEAGLARLGWQAAVERERAITIKELSRPSVPISDEEWTMAPLWVHFTRYLNLPDPDPERRLWGWASALSDWQEIQTLCQNDKMFKASLSKPQHASYLLLEAWWTAAYCDTELLEATKRYIATQAKVEIKQDPQNSRVDFGRETMTDSSLYHSACLGLFLSELHPRSWFPHVSSSVKNLQIMRRLTASQCLLQRMAYATLRPTGNVGKPEPYPRRVDWASSSNALDSTEVTVSPFYLWDTEKQMTVTVGDLPECPEYLCISHTWGRWRTRTDTPVSGVPWPVPENKLYDVRDLPAELLRLRFRYIWLDLFCIPQNRGERAQLEIANQASIFRGAHHCIAWLHDLESWGGVAAALDWMCLKYLQVTTTRDEDLIEAKLSDAASAASIPADLIKRDPDHDPSTGDVSGVEPSSWFSSLWTLQECALCPELELCSRTWEVLRDKWGVPIPLRALMEFANESKIYFWNKSPNVPFSDDLAYRRALLMAAPVNNWGANRNDAAYPVGVKDIFDVQAITGLDNVLSSSSPMAVFINANLRQCSSKNRAPAIMSALGITEWYKKNLASGKSPEVFVHNMYPLEFLQEAAETFGALFYDSFSRVPLRRRPAKPLLSTWFPSLCEGTMLPVSRDPGWAGRVTMARSQGTVGRKDHPSVAKWSLNANGSVSASCAGIVMTSRDARGMKISATISCATPMVVDYHPYYFTLHDTVDDMLETFQSLTLWRRCLYAVALYQTGGTVFGVILEEFAWGLWNKRYLTKIGRFQIPRGEMPASTDVNWEIM